MRRYIDIDKAIPIAIQAVVDVVGHGISQVDAVRIVEKFEETPIENVVKVVRCKDCKHARKAVDGYYHCRVDGCIAHNETDYCSCGERREKCSSN